MDSTATSKETQYQELFLKEENAARELATRLFNKKEGDILDRLGMDWEFLFLGDQPVLMNGRRLATIDEIRSLFQNCESAYDRLPNGISKELQMLYDESNERNLERTGETRE